MCVWASYGNGKAKPLGGGGEGVGEGRGEGGTACQNSWLSGLGHVI